MEGVVQHHQFFLSDLVLAILHESHKVVQLLAFQRLGHRLTDDVKHLGDVVLLMVVSETLGHLIILQDHRAMVL